MTGKDRYLRHNGYDLTTALQDVYLGYLQSKDCMMAFAYPSDTIVLLVFAVKDDKEKLLKVMKSMLAAGK